METVLQLLLEGETLTTAQMATVLNIAPEEVERQLEALKAERILLGWRPVLNPNATAEGQVRAAIEVKLQPERDGGFDRVAERVSRFSEVESCYLMSGSYDLLVVVKSANLHAVARFVSERLASIDHVVSTATHFLLRAYKEQGYLFERDRQDPDKPAVSP